MVPALVHIKELELHPKGKRQSFVTDCIKGEPMLPSCSLPCVKFAEN